MFGVRRQLECKRWVGSIQQKNRFQQNMPAWQHVYDLIWNDGRHTSGLIGVRVRDETALHRPISARLLLHVHLLESAPAPSSLKAEPHEISLGSGAFELIAGPLTLVSILMRAFAIFSLQGIFVSVFFGRYQKPTHENIYSAQGRKNCWLLHDSNSRKAKKRPAHLF